jgi:hypothetical protein
LPTPGPGVTTFETIRLVPKVAAVQSFTDLWAVHNSRTTYDYGRPPQGAESLGVKAPPWGWAAAIAGRERALTPVDRRVQTFTHFSVEHKPWGARNRSRWIGFGG